jgi:maleylpyruvate isomerase
MADDNSVKTQQLEELQEATNRLVRTVDGFQRDDWGGPSGLPGWTRAHVVAHLALNAEGLGGALRGILEGTPTTMYRSDEARDADIDALAAEPPEKIEERLVASAASFAEVVAAADELPAGASFERTPGGVVMRAAFVPELRLREVEIHHADLDAGYTHADWPAETVASFLDRDAGRYDGPAFLAHATDLARSWPFGSPGSDAPVVEGPGSAIAWWATGRDPGAVLSSSTGVLPTMEGR